ncbi:hypothetical protein RJ640_014573 [Escallonia rubra]|uniref:Peptidase A2 domain-containing protein n=1 Tax=Escallonia rubra TaxID=112253 RepID=A0AA88UDG6_9ASTE|nr:hypothetical protein RJ640_014573 [Escallonia rubra]
MLPRRIKFNELTPPEDWVIENKASHRQVNPHTTKVDHIIETPEGDVKFRFCQLETFSQSDKILHSNNSSQSARYSCSSIPSTRFQSCQSSANQSFPPTMSSAKEPNIIFQESETDYTDGLNIIDKDVQSSDSSSNHNHNSDQETDCHDCNSKIDYYKAILKMNSLKINVITSEESIILDKIDDPEKKKQVIFKYIHGAQRTSAPNTSKQLPTIGNTLNFSTVMDRLQAVEQKSPTFQDLQSEILTDKREMRILADRISLLELRNNEEVFSEGEDYLKPNPNIETNIEINPSNHSEDHNQEILNLDKVTFQKWYVGIKTIINKDFIFEGVALVDSGADLNCIREGIFPTKYCEYTKQALTTADSSRMKINYKISNFWVWKMTPPRTNLQVSGKGLKPGGNTRYNFKQMKKSIGSSSSSSYKDNMFKNSAYNPHDNLWDIFIIEDDEEDLPPIEVANNYLSKDWAILQRAYGKSREYYEEILRVTKSSIFTHNYEKDSTPREANPPYQFSKIEILGIISKKQWGIDPTRTRNLPAHVSPRYFNYFDYVDA